MYRAEILRREKEEYRYCYFYLIYLKNIETIRTILKNSNFLETIQTLQLLITQNLYRVIDSRRNYHYSYFISLSLIYL